MKVWLAVAAICFVPVYCHAQGPKACEDLKSEIAQKLDAKNVKGYSLEIVDKDADVGDGKVVGTCEHGSKKIVYSRTATTPPSPAKESK